MQENNRVLYLLRGIERYQGIMPPCGHALGKGCSLARGSPDPYSLQGGALIEDRRRNRWKNHPPACTCWYCQQLGGAARAQRPPEELFERNRQQSKQRSSSKGGLFSKWCQECGHQKSSHRKGKCSVHYCDCGVKPTPSSSSLLSSDLDGRAPAGRPALRAPSRKAPAGQWNKPAGSPLRALGVTLGLAVVLIGALAALYFLGDPEKARGLRNRAEAAYADFTGSALAPATPTATPTSTPWPTATPPPTPTPAWNTAEARAVMPAPPTATAAPTPQPATPTPMVFFPPTVTPTLTPARPVPTATPAPTYTPTPPPVPFTVPAIERLVLELTNEARTAEGLAPLENDPVLQEIARAHSKSMVIHGYTHYVGGRTPTDRANAANYPCYGIAENIHKLPELLSWLVWPSGFREPGRKHDAEGIAAAFVDDLMESPGHRANILNPTSYKIGVGVAFSPSRPPVDVGYVFVTQNFSPCP